MRSATAQLPTYADSDDKILTTDNAVIVLDGASASGDLCRGIAEHVAQDKGGSLAWWEVLQRRDEASSTASLEV